MERPRREQISELNLRRRGVPVKFFDTVIEDFKDYGNPSLVNVRNFVIKYLKNLPQMFDENKGIFLFGSNGVGKSMIASIIVKEAYVCRYTSKRATFTEYISEYTRIWDVPKNEKADVETNFYNNYKAVEFLALEEIGKEIDTKISMPILEDLLRYREDNRLVTIICTNLSPNELSERYGNSINSLIRGNMTPIKIFGNDKRIGGEDDAE